MATTPLAGIDVSVFQGYPGANPIDWARVQHSGKVASVYQRATYSTWLIDKSLAYNVQEMPKVHIPFGFYHFATPTGANQNALIISAQQEAQFFLKTIQSVGGIHVSGLPPVLDLEVNDNLTAAQLVAWAQAWIKEVAHATGRTPIVYTYEAFWSQYLSALDNKVPVWIAAYGSKDPQVSGEVAWQYSDTLSIPGITGHVDGDWVNPSLIPALAPTVTWNETAEQLSWSFSAPTVATYQGWAQSLDGEAIAQAQYTTTGGYWAKNWCAPGTHHVTLSFFFQGTQPVTVTSPHFTVSVGSSDIATTVQKLQTQQDADHKTLMDVQTRISAVEKALQAK